MRRRTTPRSVFGRARAVAGALLAASLLIPATTGCGGPRKAETLDAAEVSTSEKLPVPTKVRTSELGELMNRRCSTREFSSTPITLEDLSSLLWAAYGYGEDSRRTVPSAGAIYPMSVYVAATNIRGLDTGLYLYEPQSNTLGLIQKGELAEQIQAASLNQASITGAPMVIVVAGTTSMLAKRYGNRAQRYALLEAGHIGQNLALMVTELDLGMVTIGAFEDERLRRALGFPTSQEVFYVIPVGHPAS